MIIIYSSENNVDFHYVTPCVGGSSTALASQRFILISDFIAKSEVLSFELWQHTEILGLIDTCFVEYQNAFFFFGGKPKGKKHL